MSDDDILLIVDGLKELAASSRLVPGELDLRHRTLLQTVEVFDAGLDTIRMIVLARRGVIPKKDQAN